MLPDFFTCREAFKIRRKEEVAKVKQQLAGKLKGIRPRIATFSGNGGGGHEATLVNQSDSSESPFSPMLLQLWDATPQADNSLQQGNEAVTLSSRTAAGNQVAADGGGVSV